MTVILPAEKHSKFDYAWGGDRVPWDSPQRCSITHRRPEQLMRCVCKAGHTGNHRFGNFYEPGRMVNP